MNDLCDGAGGDGGSRGGRLVTSFLTLTSLPVAPAVGAPPVMFFGLFAPPPVLRLLLFAVLLAVLGLEPIFIAA